MYLCCVQCNSVTKKRIVVVNAYAKMWTFGWLKCVFSEPTAHWAPFISTENALNNNDVAMCSIVNGIYQPQTSFRWTLPSNRCALVFSLFRSFSLCVFLFEQIPLWCPKYQIKRFSSCDIAVGLFILVCFFFLSTG